MTEPPPSDHPLTGQTLSRLRKLAEGNGLAPDKIELIESREKIFTLAGVTRLAPFCEKQSSHYTGPPRGKGRIIVADSAALEAEARKRNEAFLADRDWLPAAMAELKAAPGEGWGLDGAKITLPEKSPVLAAVEICPTCQGRKLLTCENCLGQRVIICSRCHGLGQEACMVCAGTGQNPSRPGQPCLVCNGRRTVTCRACGGGGKTTCSVCHGRGGIVCARCGGAGSLTHEVALVCGVNMHFKLTGEELPSGLRRGLDRVGIANLARGHADIRLIVPQKGKKKDGADDDDDDESSGPATVRYEAKLPYADLKVRFGGARIVLVNVFGKRGLFMGVPAFLDGSLQPWRERLEKAAAGTAPLEDALEARAMRDALALELSGQGQPANLRRLYPAGLSPAATQKILLDMRRALDRLTRILRMGVALGAGLLGAALLAGFFLMPRHAEISRAWPAAGLLLDLAAPAIVMGLCWAGLGKVAQLILARRFPGRVISLHRNAGYIGYGMLAGIFAAWIAILMLAPVKPLWVSYLVSRINH